jgi:hypothetical protein
MSCGRAARGACSAKPIWSGLFAHDFDGDQRGRGDLLPGISAAGEDASGRGCISAIVTHILNKSDALQFARRLAAT